MYQHICNAGYMSILTKGQCVGDVSLLKSHCSSVLHTIPHDANNVLSSLLGVATFLGHMLLHHALHLSNQLPL